LITPIEKSPAFLAMESALKTSAVSPDCETHIIPEVPPGISYSTNSDPSMHYTVLKHSSCLKKVDAKHPA